MPVFKSSVLLGEAQTPFSKQLCRPPIILNLDLHKERYIMKKLVSLIALTFSASATIPAHAWTVTSLSNITYLENGWGGGGSSPE
jgi:hypothetical protein